MANVTARSCLAIIGALAASSAMAQMPRTISYQGVITNTAGVAIPNGNHKLVLSIYDQSAGGGVLFTETQTVPVVNGTFNVIIGSGTNGGIPTSLAFDRQYWLGISVDDSPELTPRTHLTSSPYSFGAMWADTARAVAPNAISAGAIQNGAITLNKLNTAGSTNGQVLTSTGSGVVWKSSSQLGVSSLNGQLGDVELLAGNNVQVNKNGNKLTIGTINSGKISSVNSSDNAITVTNADGPGVGIGIAQGGITENLVADGAVSSNKLKSGSVTSDKILDGTIATADLADNAITSAKIVDGTIAAGDLSNGAVTAAKIGPDAVNSAKILDGTVATSDLADASITTAKLADGSVAGAKIPDGGIATAKLADGSVSTVKLADGGVTTAKVADGAITDAKVANGISFSKIIGFPISFPPNGPAGGDLTGTYPNPSVAAGAITSAKIADGTIVDADVSPTAAIAYGKLNLSGGVVNADINPTAGIAYSKLNLSGGIVNNDVSPTAAIAYGKLNLNNSIQTSDLTDGSVTDVKVANGISYSKLSGAPTSLPPSGAAGGDLAGTFPNPTVAANAITSAKIADGTIVDADVSPTAAIAYSKIAGAPTSLPPSGAAGGDLTGTYPNPTIAANAVTTTKIADGSVTDAKVANGISYSKLSGAPTSLPPSGAAGGDLAGTFPNPTVAANAVTTVKLADSAVSGLKLGTAAVNTAHIADGAVTDAKVANGISYSKLSGAPTSLPPSGAAGGDLTGTFPNPTVAANAITSAKILDGTIVDADISPTAAIAYSKLSLTNAIVTSDLTDGSVTDVKVANGISYSKLSGAPTSLPPSGAAGGDLTGTYPNPTVAANAITSAKILDGTIVNADISPTAAIAYAKLLLTNSVTTADLVDGSVTDAKVANGISYSKLSGAPTSLPPSGAAGGDLTGTFPNPVVATNAITSAKIADGTITNADISAAASISYSKLNLTGSLQGSDIAAGTFTSTNSHRALGNNDNVARELRFLEPSGSGVNFSAFKAQAQAGDITYTLPNAAPTGANQVLQVQAVAGNNATLSWGTIGGGSITFSRTGVIANAGNTTYNVQASDDIIGVDMSAGTNFTVNLGPATTVGEILIIKIERYNNALLPVLTIQPNGTDKIEGANNLAFGNAGGNRRLYSDGAGNWYTW